MNDEQPAVSPWRIDSNQLGSEFDEAPEMLARAVEVYADAEDASLHAELEFDIVEARLKIEVRERLTLEARATFQRARQVEIDMEASEKDEGRRYKKIEIRLQVPTVGDIEAHVIVSDEYRVAREAHIAADVKAKLTKGLCRAAETKRDMLTNIGMKRNAEWRVRPIDVANAGCGSNAGSSSSLAFGSGLGEETNNE